jgi:hypothetical protein
MFIGRKAAASALASAALALSSPSCSIFAFSTRAIVSSAKSHDVASVALGAATNLGGVDTDSTLPDFATKEEYESYLMAAGKLPSGFAVGTAKGTFVSAEAPAMGNLPIRATVIHLTEGPTDSWAAVFTSNKVNTRFNFHHIMMLSLCSIRDFPLIHMIITIAYLL